jgi:hypothetical protein
VNDFSLLVNPQVPLKSLLNGLSGSFSSYIIGSKEGRDKHPCFFLFMVVKFRQRMLSV